MIESDTAHKLIKKVITEVLSHGYAQKVWGGTIPDQIGDKGSPNDFDREMIEHEPFSFSLTNPLARWSDLSDHWVGISLRETEDTLQTYNPGHVIKYSRLYPVWLEKDGKFNYTYGDRIFNYAGIGLDQFKYCLDILKKHPSTRKACIVTWHPPQDLFSDYVPCNDLFQLRIVDGKLNWITVVRSLDVLRGLTENIFMFTILQEYAATLLQVPLGEYITTALNPHLYKEQIDKNVHIQNVPDPYDTFEPKPAFITPFPFEEFKEIDDFLFKDSYAYAIIKAKKLPEYWRNWKLALIYDYLRLKKKNVKEKLGDITNEFRYSVERRLK